MPYVEIFAALALALASALTLGFDPACSTCFEDFTFDQQPSKVVVRLDGVAVASFVYGDAAVGRPYWCDVRSPSGIPLTHSHNPLATDDLDHVAMHTVWMSFEDLSGCDYWRCKARTQQVRFLESKRRMARTADFLCSITISEPIRQRCSQPKKLTINSARCLTVTDFSGRVSFMRSTKTSFLETKEEMSLGVRMVASLAEKRGQGERILDSDNRVGTKQV